MTSSFAAEHLLFLVIVVAAFAVRWRPNRATSLIRERFEQLAANGTASCSIVVAFSVVPAVVGAWLHGVPLPQYHDDYNYLLAADTFVLARLANPPHPLWPHFETMHALMRPTYAAISPPGQSLALALGMKLFGEPMAGIWIAEACACAAIWWALREWLGASLALLGGIAAAVHPTLQRWNEVYHSAAVPALGGALMFGATARMARRPTWLDSAVLGAGAALLAISRPWEGLSFALVTGLVLLVAAARAGTLSRAIRVAPSGAIVIAAGLLFLGAYNRAVTGSALRFPHLLYDHEYLPASNFLWQPPRPIPHYRNVEMAQVFRVSYLSHVRRIHAPGGMRDEMLKRIDVAQQALLGAPSNDLVRSAWPLLLVLVIPLFPLLREEWPSLAFFVALAIFAIAPFAFTWWLQTHYFSPAVVMADALILLLLRRLARMWSARGSGAFLAAAVLTLFFVNSAASWMQWVRLPEQSFEAERRRIERMLEQRPGRDLIIVAPEVFNAVHNSADIDAAPVIWARDLGPAANARLRAYYHDRVVWRLTMVGGRLRLLMD